MICKHCRQEIPDSAKFCAYCSTPVGEDKPLEQAPAPGSAPGIANTPQPQAQSAEEEKTPWIAIVGFVLALFTGLIGLIISVVAYIQIKKAHRKRGKGWAIAGIIVGALHLLPWVLAIPYYLGGLF